MEWKECTIGDLGRVVTGKTPRTSINENYGGSIPFLSPSDDMSQKSNPDTARKLSELGLREVKNCLIPTNSICVSCIGSDLGKVVMATTPLVTNQQINSIIPNETVDPDFIYYLMTIVGKELNYLSKTSTAVPIINKTTFSNYKVIIPNSKSTQRRIASILSSLDRKIELNNKINAQLEEMAQAIFKSWFVDFEPFKDGKFVESELGLIPEGWRVGKAEDFYTINIGKTPPRKENEWFSDNNEDNIWVSISDMGSCGMFISDSSEYLTNSAIKKHNITMVEKNAVLLSFKLTIGRVAIADTKLTTNEAIARFIIPDIFHLEYLYLLLKRYDYNSLGSTSSIATAVNSKTIKGMKMIIPTDKVLEIFSKKTNPLFERIRTISKENLHLAQLRDTLLPKLMNGEIEI